MHLSIPFLRFFKNFLKFIKYAVSYFFIINLKKVLTNTVFHDIITMLNWERHHSFSGWVCCFHIYGGIAQLARASGSYPAGRRFKSHFHYQVNFLTCWSVKYRRTKFFIIWPGGQAVKTPPFHGGNTSSILVRVTKTKSVLAREWIFVLYYSFFIIQYSPFIKNGFLINDE